jgi:hypothetical protein
MTNKIPTVQQNAALIESVRFILKQCPHVTFERALDAAKQAQNLEPHPSCNQQEKSESDGFHQTPMFIGRDDRI